MWNEFIIFSHYGANILSLHFYWNLNALRLELPKFCLKNILSVLVQGDWFIIPYAYEDYFQVANDKNKQKPNLMDFKGNEFISHLEQKVVI